MSFPGVLNTPPGRALVWFWAAVLGTLGTGAVVLQILGPPAPPPPKFVAAPAPVAMAPTIKAPAAPAPRPQRPPESPIAAPAPEMLDPATGLPRIAADGRMPMNVYAAGFDATDPRPRVGVLLAGMGLNSTESEEAIRVLPPAITFAFSPYAAQPMPLVETARAARHEFLISLPLEPQGAPLNDAGNQALLTSAPAEQNRQRLEWSLSRISGYVGATGALGTLRGERFANTPELMAALLRDLAGRGLLYIDPRPDAPDPSQAWGRAVDVVIDDPPTRAELEANLDRLEQLARDRGSALGLAGTPTPLTVARIAVWAAGLAHRGVALAPASALVNPPPNPEPTR
jgi:polysaccharide deacetylase 2 family uncharacterized protein YibQ